MYRILIVDDEPLVRRGIKNSVNWNQQGVEMVAEAANGVEALSQVLENVPDVVLLDINMPRMDGLEFASIVKKQYPHIRIVIITGYNDFEYVRSALRAGVDDYILKPITKEDVQNIINKQLACVEEMEEQPPNSFIEESRAKQNVLNALLKKDILPANHVENPYQVLGWKEDTPIFFVLMREYLSSCGIWGDGKTDSLAEFAILNISNEILGEQSGGFAFLTYKNELAMVLPGSKKEVEENVNRIHDSILDFLEIPVDFAISCSGKLPMLATLYEKAQYALNCAFVLSDQNIIFYEDIAASKDKSFEYPQQIEMELLEKMFSANRQECSALIDSFFKQLVQAKPDNAKCKNMLLRLLLKMLNTIESVASHTEQNGEGEDLVFFDPLVQVESFESLEDARLWVQDMYARTYNYLSSIKSRTGKLFVKIKTYIDKSYADVNLNLKKCSEDLFLSSNYISLILKKETGKTFVDYLNDYRIAKAAELLVRSDAMIYEVSSQIGFTHSTYFSSVFKKVMGMSPKQYKESN